jgi:hypothetical protein
MRASSLIKLSCGIAVLAAILPASALAQASRTWVSGSGSDANPCSRTAPCQTFAGAILKTAARGEINCLDPAGYGGFTILHSITIKCAYTEGGVLVAGTNAIVINAAATDTVILEGLDINGLGQGSLSGVVINQAKTVKILKTEIHGFDRNAVDMKASNNGAKLLLADSHLFENSGNGVLVAPPSGGNSTATLRNNLIVGNRCAIAATSHGYDLAFNFAANCGTNLAGAGGPAKINAFHNLLSSSADAGVFANGASSSVRVGDNNITDNTNGFRAIDTGAFGGITSFGDNFLAGNITDGNPNFTVVKK